MRWHFGGWNGLMAFQLNSIRQIALRYEQIGVQTRSRNKLNLYLEVPLHLNIHYHRLAVSEQDWSPTSNALHLANIVSLISTMKCFRKGANEQSCPATKNIDFVARLVAQPL